VLHQLDWQNYIFMIDLRKADITILLRYRPLLHVSGCSYIFQFINCEMAFSDQHKLFFSYLLLLTCTGGKSTIGFYLFASCSEVLHKHQTCRSHVKSRFEFKVWRRCWPKCLPYVHLLFIICTSIYLKIELEVISSSQKCKLFANFQHTIWSYII